MKNTAQAASTTDQGGIFATTSWKTVLQARHDDPGGRAALERLLSRYYSPIHRIIQHHQRSHPEQAQDLTQEFIKDCLKRDFLREVGPEKGRFRTFIRGCLKNFLADQHDRATAQKRGGGAEPLSLHQTDEDGNPILDPAAETADPCENLDRAWAREVVNQALARLEAECSFARRAELFQELKGHLAGHEEPAGMSASLAARLGLKEETLYVARHRLRQRLGELIAEEVKATVCEESDWRDELRYLMQLVGR